MKIIKNIFFLLTVISFTIIRAQVTNLVPNGDFEIYSSLPTGNSQSNRAIGWNNVNGNYSGITGSPDFFNTLSYLPIGSITPYSGNGQMGLITYINYNDSTYIWREYISTQLITQMITGHQYKVSFNLTNGTGFVSYTKAVNNFGIHFSNNPLHQDTSEYIAVTPQIEIDTIIYFWNYWQHFSFNYIADNSFKYITIGNFRDDPHTLISTYGNIGAYYFIDKIEIIPVLNIIGDTLLCKGDTASLTATADSIVQWATAIKPDSIFSTNTTIKVNPAITTTYLAYGATDTASFTVNVVNPPIVNLGNDTTLCNGYSIVLDATQNNATYLWQDNSVNSTYTVTQQGMYWVTVETYKHCSTSDTVIISYTGCETPEVFIPNSFSPNGDGVNDIFNIKTIAEFSKFELYIYNRWGQLVFETDDAAKAWDGSFKGNTVPIGVYTYFIEATAKTNNEIVKYSGKITVVK